MIQPPKRQRLEADHTCIDRVLCALLRRGDVIELRIIHTRRNTISGYFDDRHKLTKAACDLDRKYRPEAIYVTLNPVQPALLARAENHVKDFADVTTADKDILCRRWLLIDCDAQRPAGISATDAEHDAAMALARRIRTDLRAEGWPEPILADSGNGAHLLYLIDLPNDDASRDLVKDLLKALAHRFDTDIVKIDQSVFNAARIVKLYGTPVRKGDFVAARPHRVSRCFWGDE